MILCSGIKETAAPATNNQQIQPAIHPSMVDARWLPPESAITEEVHPPDPPRAVCAICSKPARAMCGRCRVQWYCSRDCQKSAWAVHSTHCQGFPAPLSYCDIKWYLEDASGQPSAVKVWQEAVIVRHVYLGVLEVRLLGCKTTVRIAANSEDVRPFNTRTTSWRFQLSAGMPVDMRPSLMGDWRPSVVTGTRSFGFVTVDTGEEFKRLSDRLVRHGTRTPREYLDIGGYMHVCPIVMEPITGIAAVTRVGQTYSLPAVKEWFQKGRTTDPLTNAPLPHQHLALFDAADSTAIANFVKKVRRDVTEFDMFVNEFQPMLGSGHGVRSEVRSSVYFREILYAGRHESHPLYPPMDSGSGSDLDLD